MSSSADDSPSKAPSGWVQFDEASRPQSARGTVTSIASAQQMRLDRERQAAEQAAAVEKRDDDSDASDEVDRARNSAAGRDSDQPGALQITEIQVVDEHALRKKSNASRAQSTAATNNNTVYRQQPEQMDNVHLGDDANAAPTADQMHPQMAHAIRGRRFQNGEVIVTLLPVNERFPWVTPARFRPELVPEELMAPVLTLTVEDYVQVMEKLTTDMRFTLFNICYKRILIIWIVTAFVILLGLLFSGFQGIELFACGVAWLILNAGAIFLCMWIKIRLNKQLEKCMASVNATLLKHNLILGLDDRGKLSCHKVNLCFIYLKPTDCINKIEAILAEKADENPQNGEIFNREAYLRDVENFEDVEVVVSGRNSVRVDRRKERAEKLFLHYIQRWSKDYLRRRLDWVVEDLYGRTEYTSNTNPRHMATALCPCQYIEEHLRNKRTRESLNPCSVSSNPCHWCD